ncbi:DUF1996 domain-containing protein [Actinospongicola halichondriae]|uniref:DUF1996 domain-containing protein n=1 Tax=Actinospongicola halichondriae TaxID=3236844 RepID=UPI003D46DC1F
MTIAGRVLAAVTVTAALASCGVGDTATGPPDLPDHRGRFVTVCAPAHHAPDDPIVFPDQPGSSHLHEFFGNVAIDATSTADTARGQDTTCETKADHASYWVPALLDADHERVAPDGADVYYRAGRGVDPTTVQAYPYGLKMIAGEAASTRPQPTEIVGWTCSDADLRAEAPRDCTGDLRLRITFPDCWNDRDLDSDDHRRHMAYSGSDGCPDSHPTPVPQLELVVRYPYSGDADGLMLSAGETFTAHADFWNLWDPDALEREVRSCLHRDVVCGDTRS